jgi:hypothetical protein
VALSWSAGAASLWTQASVPEPITAAATTATPSRVNLRIVIFLASFEGITQALDITNLLQCTIAHIFVFKWNIHIMTQCTNFRRSLTQAVLLAVHRLRGGGEEKARGNSGFKTLKLNRAAYESWLNALVAPALMGSAVASVTF